MGTQYVLIHDLLDDMYKMARRDLLANRRASEYFEVIPAGLRGFRVVYVLPDRAVSYECTVGWIEKAPLSLYDNGIKRLTKDGIDMSTIERHHIYELMTISEYKAKLALVE